MSPRLTTMQGGGMQGGGPPAGAPAPLRRAPRRRRRRRALVALGGLLAAAAGVVGVHRLLDPGLPPVRAAIVAAAEGQVGYRTDPPDSYCNRFSAYWDAGADTCGPGLRSEEWCADFAAWAWRQGGVPFTYLLAGGDLNASSASFYEWALSHGTWHPAGSGYVPVPGDVAVYGLDPATTTAAHVAVVVGVAPGGGPDVVNGDGDRTGFSVVERGTDQTRVTIGDRHWALSGYASPLSPGGGSAGSG